MVHLTLGEWRVACARVTVPEGDLVLACGALATPTESPPPDHSGRGDNVDLHGRGPNRIAVGGRLPLGWNGMLSTN
jgi:hypothetical protein